ncbi:DNA methyltransferase [Bacillus subtilis]|uniref:DNA methyltransferase n=1 Tax=Bacillus subtilis TaxID=1423 RepID=UPI003F844609
MINPISQSVKAKSHTDQYKMHKYFARRPYNVFQNLINHYTKENDLVLDVFCGGGVTVFESVAMNRRAIGVDLNPLATFITKMQLKKVNLALLNEVGTSFINNLEKELSSYYVYKYNNEDYQIEWVEWAYEVECPLCSSIIMLTEENKAISSKGKPKNGYYCCPNASCKGHDKEVGVKRTDCKSVGSHPLRMKIFNSEQTLVIKLSKEQASLIKSTKYTQLIQEDMIIPDEEIPLNWDRTHEDKLNEKGVYRFRDLFTERNFSINVVIFNKILTLKDQIDNDIVDCIYFAFSSSLRYTNKMTRVTENWENGNPTAMDKHAYWLPNVYIEANVIEKFKDRLKAVLKGLSYTEKKIPEGSNHISIDELMKGRQGYAVLNQSSTNLPLSDKSVDVIITDPPYGSNVQYSELSSFWNIWLKAYENLDDFIFNQEEAVMNRKKNIEGFKDLDHYEKVLYEVFLECNRVLKEDGYLVFTFNNKNLKVWISLLKATIRSGFIIPEGGVIFQDFIKSYKNTSHLRYSGNVHGDFIYSFIKGNSTLNPTLKEVEPLNYITNHITSIVNELYNVKAEYTTTELYEKIFNGLIRVLSDLIAANLDEFDKKFDEINNQSNDFIDNLLRRELVFENDVWKRKEESLC